MRHWHEAADECGSNPHCGQHFSGLLKACAGGMPRNSGSLEVRFGTGTEFPRFAVPWSILATDSCTCNWRGGCFRWIWRRICSWSRCCRASITACLATIFPLHAIPRLVVATLASAHHRSRVLGKSRDFFVVLVSTFNTTALTRLAIPARPLAARGSACRGFLSRCRWYRFCRRAHTSRCCRGGASGATFLATIFPRHTIPWLLVATQTRTSQRHDRRCRDCRRHRRGSATFPAAKFPSPTIECWIAASQAGANRRLGWCKGHHLNSTRHEKRAKHQFCRA